MCLSKQYIVFLNSTLQVLQKVSVLNNIVNNKIYLYGRNIYHMPIFDMLLSQHVPIQV